MAYALFTSDQSSSLKDVYAPDPGEMTPDTQPVWLPAQHNSSTKAHYTLQGQG